MAFEVKYLARAAFAGGHTTWVYTGTLEADVPFQTFLDDMAKSQSCTIYSGDLLILPDVSRIVFLYWNDDRLMAVPAR